MPILIRSKGQAVRFSNRFLPEQIAGSTAPGIIPPVDLRDRGYPAKAANYPLTAPFIEKDKDPEDQNPREKSEHEIRTGYPEIHRIPEFSSHTAFFDIGPDEEKYAPDWITTDWGFAEHRKAGTIEVVDYVPAPTQEQIEISAEIEARKKREGELESKLGYHGALDQMQEELVNSRAETDKLMAKHQDLLAKSKKDAQKNMPDEPELEAPADSPAVTADDPIVKRQADLEAKIAKLTAEPGWNDDEKKARLDEKGNLEKELQDLKASANKNDKKGKKA